MKKKHRYLKPKVLFNASVVLAGMKSPKGGSGCLLSLMEKGNIEGLISETIFDEILRHSDKIGYTKGDLGKRVSKFFPLIKAAPKTANVVKYKMFVIDEGDAHVLAASEETGADYLVTLDKKHLLVLKDKIKGLRIVTPGELIASIR